MVEIPQDDTSLASEVGGRWHKDSVLEFSDAGRDSFCLLAVQGSLGEFQMELTLDGSLIAHYHSERQIARVLTEDWIARNMYCPHCGNERIHHFANNKPVADFYCPSCGNQYELKSKTGKLGRKINDGAYTTMIERITGNDNPDFLFMNYSRGALLVTDLIFIPKHFLVPDIIERRKPLPPTAERAGWVGCNILINQIPEQGRIEIVSHGTVVDRERVINQVSRSGLLSTGNISARGWLLDVLKCVNRIQTQIFSLEEMYRFENELRRKYPQNNNIRPKIRQQLQFLRDRGFIEFLGNGTYRKVV